MGRILIESGIVILLVLIGISVFIPDNGNSVENVIVEFENSVEAGEIIDDGELETVEVSEENNSTFIAKVNSKIANTIVNGLNSVFNLGLKIIRIIVN